MKRFYSAAVPSSKAPRPGRHPAKPRPKPRPRPVPSPSPTAEWPAWTDEDRWESRPTYEEPRPSPRLEAMKVGFDLGYAHDADAVPPAEMPEGIALSWWYGRNLGWLRRESDDRAIDRAERRHRETGVVETDIYPAGATT